MSIKVFLISVLAGLALIGCSGGSSGPDIPDTTLPPDPGPVGPTPTLWVDAANGSNANTGQSKDSALQTIQAAAQIAVPRDVIGIVSGVYREASIRPANSGTPADPILFVAADGPGTVMVRGSISASSMNWTRLGSNSIGLPAGVDPNDIFVVDLSSLALTAPPRFVVDLGATGNINRLPLAREPDWQVSTEWKHHEFWWAAEGGSSIPSCDPTVDGSTCDASTFSSTSLIDARDDVEPAGIEAGSLSTVGDLTGGTIIALDPNSGFSLFRCPIVAHDIAQGQITALDDPVCSSGRGQDLGRASKYYVENRPQLLDNPGEWWFDMQSGQLYLWPIGGNPQTMNIEISTEQIGFDLSDRSNISIDGLTVEFFDGHAIDIRNNSDQRSHNVSVSNSTIRYAETGVFLKHHVINGSDTENKVDGFILADSEVSYMDRHAIDSDFTSAGAFDHPGVSNTHILRNELHHIGFYYGTTGTRFFFPDELYFEDNHVHHVSLSGVLFMRSIIESGSTFGFSPDEIKTGDTLISGNLIERTCLNQNDCGGLKIAGSVSDKHVHRDMLIVNNIMRDNFGWSYAGEKRGKFVNGMGARGLYVDNASGVHAYHNIAYNNAFGGFSFALVWRDGVVVMCNNLVANSINGFFFAGRNFDTHINVDTRVLNNIILNNERGVLLEDNDGNLDNTQFDFNAYFNNGWKPIEDGGIFGRGAFTLVDTHHLTLAEVQAGSSFEVNGADQNPMFLNYNVDDHALFDNSWPDFRTTSSSSGTLDNTTNLPQSLTDLMQKFGVPIGDFDDVLQTADR